MLRNILRIGIFCFFSSILSNAANAQTCEVFDRPTGQFGLELVSVVSGAEVDGPTSMVQPPNDSSKWFVLDKEGVVSLYSHGESFTRVGTMVDLTDRVTRTYDGRSWNEMGLLSIAVHPDFANNGYIYLYYSATGPNAVTPLYARLSRFTSHDNGLTIDPASEEVVIQLDRDKVFHWGGQMMFNPNDGYFHMSIGDGGVRNKAQNYFDLNGSFIRLDMGDGSLPYSIPADNPFADGVNAIPEIFAKGLRNPWRWSIDTETNRIFLGDVGKADWEEVNYIEAGKNYGWPIRQGAHCHDSTTCNTAGLTDPLVEYPHDDTGGVAIIGGYVYRGSLMPDFYGHYIYADALGRVWSFDTSDIANAQPTVIFEDDPQKYSFAEGADKELYLLAIGKIDRLTQSSGGVNNSVPGLLSETGCFESTNPLVPLESSQYYDINAPLWSDGAVKHRWMNVPDDESISVNSTDDWDFPIGTAMVKNFSIDNQLIETRLFMRHDDGEWAGYTYEWDDAQTDATLVPSAGKERQLGQQTWLYPSRLQCVQCHTSSIGNTAGPETAQLNMYFRDSSNNWVNQLNVLEDRYTIENADFSDPTELPVLANMSDDSQTDHWKSRSYLYSNCAMCHQPGGTGQGPEDFRYSISDAQINAIDVTPTLDDLGLVGSKLIFPGDSTMSVMALRMHTLDPAIRMPLIATSVEDTQATQVIDDWIDSMDGLPASNADSCGEPVLDGKVDAGIHLWKDCSSPDTWNVSATTGDSYKKIIGRIVSDDGITIESLDLTQSNDSVGLSNSNKTLDFDLDTRWSLIDSFSFTETAGADSCLIFDFPVNTQIWLGADKYQITTNTLNLTTLESCATEEINPLGEPEIDSSSESGVFVWQESNDSWVFRVYGGGLNSALFASGTLTASSNFSSISTTSIESNDLFDTSDPAKINFNLKVRAPWVDGFEVSLPNQTDLCLDLDDPSIELHIGENKMTVSTPFNLSTLQACDSTPNTNISEGRPAISADSDEGVFVWQENGVWHVSSTTDSSYYFIQGRVQTYDGLSLINWEDISLEGSTDFINIQAANRFLFRMVTGLGDIDEMTFVVPNTGESCLDVKIPDPAMVFLGPNKIPISVPYNLTSLEPCSRG